MRAERYWHQAAAVSEQALHAQALVPLLTRVETPPGCEPFVVRRLLSRPPRHLLRMQGPRPNPFFPWDRPLEVDRVGERHVLLLNKYPVQPCHLLLITSTWQPQSGWIDAADWRAVAAVAADTGGLWFLNSGTTAGASQPHRHLQLLPRRSGEPSCPLAPLLLRQIEGGETPWPWRYHLSARRDPRSSTDLPVLYREHARALGLGDPARDRAPCHAHNLLFDDEWFLSVRRVREHCAGFSVNGLGFAGYLMGTDRADLVWLGRHGPWALLAGVAAPA